MHIGKAKEMVWAHARLLSATVHNSITVGDVRVEASIRR